MIDALIQCDTGTRIIDLDSSFVCLFVFFYLDCRDRC